MKRSRAVPLTLVAAAVGGPSACAGPAPQQALHCVARGNNRVVADSLCNAARLAATGGPSGAFGATAGSSGEFGAADAQGTRPYGAVYGGGPHLSPFLWYYGGRVASGFASAGSYAPLEGARYRSPSGFTTTGTARRGFFSRAFSGRGAASRGAVWRGGFGSIGAARGGGFGG